MPVVPHLSDAAAAPAPLDREALSGAPTPGEAAALLADRDAFVAHLLGPLLGRQASKGASW